MSQKPPVSACGVRLAACTHRSNATCADWFTGSPAEAFGFEPTGETMTDDSGMIQHAGMRLGDAAIMFAPPPPDGTMQPPAQSGARDALSFYIYVPDIDVHHAQARGAGAKVLQTPADQFWGDRIAIYRCPDGYHWTFATHVAEFAPPAG